MMKISQEELDQLWDRLSEIANGNLWNQLTKEEWELARYIFEIQNHSV